MDTWEGSLRGIILEQDKNIQCTSTSLGGFLDTTFHQDRTPAQSSGDFSVPHPPMSLVWVIKVCVLIDIIIIQWKPLLTRSLGNSSCLTLTILMGLRSRVCLPLPARNGASSSTITISMSSSERTVSWILGWR